MVKKGYFAEGKACAAGEETTPYATAPCAGKHHIEISSSTSSADAQCHGVAV
jgi:hypothetical protein